MASLFTLRSATDGRFGHGVVPDDWRPRIDELARLCGAAASPDQRAGATHHEWCRHCGPDIRAAVAAIRSDPFWAQLADGTAAVVHELDRMDEIYHSRAPHRREMLYGAAANYDLHVDGVFAFPGIRVYRVLIGLTDNDAVETQFPGLGVCRRIGKGDFVVFDFDRARHRVVRVPEAPPTDRQRILLKLHFCVCAPGAAAPGYVWIVAWAYQGYEWITRRLMAAGTDPRTMPQFAVGLLGQFVVRHPYGFRLCALLPLMLVGLVLAEAHRASAGVAALAALVTGTWMAAAVGCWLRYRWFGVR